MQAEELYNELNQMIALKKTRLKYTSFVLNDLSLLPKLVDIVFMVDDEVSYRAAWILELVCEKDINLIIPYLDQFTKNLKRVTFNSAIRPLAKVCSFIAKAYYSKTQNPLQNSLTKNQKKLLIESCFDWLISKQKVAAKVYAMETLFYLGKEYDWIHPELILTIEHDLPFQSAAYKARGKHILKNVDKYSS